MKKTRLFIMIISLLILTACSQEKIKEVDKDNISTVKDSREIKEKETLISAPDLRSEEGLRKYLAGQWFSQIDYISNIVVSMDIDENLDLQISFYDSFTKESKGDYKGRISLDKIEGEMEEAYMMNIELNDPEYSMASFYFTHRTIYDGKRLMSMFFTKDGNFVFQKLMGDDESQYDIEELIFENATGESSQEKVRKNDKFYAVYWDHGVENESIWLDDVEWEPRDYDDFGSTYPRWMKRYENNKKESILYKMNPNKSFDILGDNMFKGEVYYVETDEDGNIIDLIDADYKEYMETQQDNHMDPELEDLIFDILMTDIVEIEEYLDQGMDFLLTGEIVAIDDQDCYLVYMGTNHEEAFVREITYGVNPWTREVYRLDVLNDTWEILALC